MQDEQQHYPLRCDWEPCNKRLVDFCHVCDVNNKFACHSICCDADSQEAPPTPPLQ